MTFWEVLIVGIGLSVDAFVVTVAKTLRAGEHGGRTILSCAAAFGFFQFLMPVIGFFAGEAVSGFVSAYSKYLVFGIFLLLGIKTIADVFKKDSGESEEQTSKAVGIWELLLLAVSTSIDALAAGFGLSLVEDVHLLPACACIGLTTFVLCLAGGAASHRFGSKLEGASSVIGGILLILLALKQLLF